MISVGSGACSRGGCPAKIITLTMCGLHNGLTTIEVAFVKKHLGRSLRRDESNASHYWTIAIT